MTTTRPRRAATAAAAALLALAGCGGDPAPTAAPTTPATPTAAAATTSPAPTASPTPDMAAAEDADADEPLAFGKTATIGGNIATATVYGYRQPVAASAPRPVGQPGFTWGAADVKVCALKNTQFEGITVSNDPWKLVYADDTQMEPSSIGYNQFPEPGYPFGERDLRAGRCVRGWVTFPVPAKKRPTHVEYVPENHPGARWTVK